MTFLLFLSLALFFGLATLSAQNDTDNAYFLDWGIRLNKAWMTEDSAGLNALLSDDMLITLCWRGGIQEITKPSFVSRVTYSIGDEYRCIFWGKSTPYFYSKDTLSVRRSKDGNTVWVLQNHFYKEEWKENNRMKQDSGIISMQTTFQQSGGQWKPVAAFINNLELKLTNNWGCFAHSVDISAFEDKSFRMQAAVKTAVQEDGYAVLWARVDKKDGGLGFFDNMMDRPVKSGDWNIYKIQGKVDAAADSLFLGGCLSVPGTAWFDDFLLEVETSPGQWKKIDLNNSGFETEEFTGTAISGWTDNGRFTNFTFKFTENKPFKGKYALEITGRPER